MVDRWMLLLGGYCRQVSIVLSLIVWLTGFSRRCSVRPLYTDGNELYLDIW